MPQMNNAQARLIDPILTSVARGYRNNSLIGALLFPRVPVSQRGGKIITFGKEDFMLYNTRRAPGQNTKRIQFGHAGAPFSLEDHSLEGQAPIETMQEAQAVPGIDVGARAIRGVQNIIELRLEKSQADLALNAANYPTANKVTLSGTGQWSDFSGTSDPISDVEAGKEAVRKVVGRRPNVLEIGAAVFAKLKVHPKIVDRLKYTQREVATPDLLAALFGLDEVIVGDSVYADDAGVLSDVWGKDALLVYRDRASAADWGSPSYGYTYVLDGYPIAEEPYFERNPKSWIYPYTDVCAPVLAGAESGYLIKAAVA